MTNDIVARIKTLSVLGVMTGGMLLLSTSVASAETSNTIVEACQTFARNQYRDIKEVRQLQLFNNAKTRNYRFDGDVGSQFVSSELLGNGRLMTKKGWQNFSYLCLLESDRKALYFRILNNINF